jgi:hypothetical protein
MKRSGIVIGKAVHAYQVNETEKKVVTATVVNPGADDIMNMRKTREVENILGRDQGTGLNIQERKKIEDIGIDRGDIHVVTSWIILTKPRVSAAPNDAVTMICDLKIERFVLLLARLTTAFSERDP